MRLFILIVLILSCNFICGQGTDNLRPEKGSLQLEAGLFGEFFYQRLSGPQMEAMSGKALPSYAPQIQQDLSQSSSSSINAGYYTLVFQKQFRDKSMIWWSAGLSFLSRSVAECSFTTDTITLTRPGLPAGDPAQIQEKKMWNGYASISGMQINVPLGIKLVPTDKSRRWVIVGFNIAPGINFNHTYSENMSVFTTTAQGQDAFTGLQPSPEDDYFISKNVPGNYFTTYAGVPINFCINPASRWQFMISYETGYNYTWLGEGITSGVVLMRLGLGVKFLL